MAPEPHKRVVLVLGASGKVGRMLRSIWREKSPEDIEFIYVYRNNRNDQQGVVWQPRDPSDHLPKAHAIVALWGATPRSGHAFSENADLANVTLELAKALEVERVLHFSSSAVYLPSTKPLTETISDNAPNAYGQSKLDMEQQITSWMSENEVTFSNVILRLANVAGADALFNNMKPGNTVTLDRFADGLGPRRSYIGSVDLAKVIEALINDQSVLGPVNVAAPKATEMADLVKAAGCRVEWTSAPDGAIATVALDTRRLQSILKIDEAAAEAQHLIDCAKKGEVWP
ncbi:NAD(P)-dependent oxidoreductase [uncultured Pelagimonas sp.]|uniref:NAD-dependent epimerase/dehydratase family protein n=1 Tax=uncultured Pelagimonas sp. TaxID=1618102 RepID=UPI002613722F|nr:NAD-dependent epimerase/dehydratase family protein [uncultured Pelagimonas sp.]